MADPLLNSIQGQIHKLKYLIFEDQSILDKLKDAAGYYSGLLSPLNVLGPVLLLHVHEKFKMVILVKFHTRIPYNMIAWQPGVNNYCLLSDAWLQLDSVMPGIIAWN